MATDETQVAIVVRTKDRPEFLRRALQSITEQNEQRWHAYVVNDGGFPESVDQLVGSLAPADQERITVIHSATSRGRWVSANAGVLASSAPYLVLHDDDDSWHPDFLARALDYLSRHPERPGVVSRIEIVWERLAGETYQELGREVFQEHLPAPTLGATLLFNRFVPIGFLYRRTLHEELGLYDQNLPVVGDWDFYVRVLTNHALEYLEEPPLVYWHQRTDDNGSTGNSVVAESANHLKYDALIRDRALREYVSENGTGLVLYLTKFIDTRLVEIEAGIRAEIRQSSAITRTLSNMLRKIRNVFSRRER